MSEINMPEKLWDLANVITGFGVLQSLAMTFALTKSDELRLLNTEAGHWCAFGGTVVFTALYIIAIIWCRIAASSNGDDANLAYIWKVTTSGRVAIVLAFTLIMCVALWGHWLANKPIASG